jgi:hypothetical protein
MVSLFIINQLIIIHFHYHFHLHSFYYLSHFLPLIIFIHIINLIILIILNLFLNHFNYFISNHSNEDVTYDSIDVFIYAM